MAAVTNDPGPLTPRYYPLRPHPVQLRLETEGKRFALVPAGRRSGKTERAKRRLVRCAMAKPGGRFLAAAPTFMQAKSIYWKDLKALLPAWAIAGKPSESELRITLVHGAEIVVAGMDKPQRVEGQPWDGIVLDEYANMKAEAWQENIRPALSDRRGWAWLIGVPEGRNHYYDLTKKHADDPDWGIYTWKSADILPPEEVDAARRDMDPLTFAQEYDASFVNFEGRAYYVFDETVHCARLFPDYNPLADLHFAFDFNVDPGVAAVIQELPLPARHATPLVSTSGMPLFANRPAEVNIGTAVIGEVYIERNSNTPAVCNRLIQDWGDHRGRIFLYGDASGGARGSAKTEGSDWDLIKKAMYAHYGRDRVFPRVPAANPSERSRVNAVNTRCRSGDGTVRLMVDPGRAPNVVRDFEGVRVLKGGSGELDKKHDPKLTHISDALGYYVVHQFPTTQKPKATSQHAGLQ